MSETIVIVAAVIEYQGRYLLARRSKDKSHPGYWEFPGGKLAPGEAPAEAINREIYEEFGVKSEAKGLMGVVDEVVDGVPMRLVAMSVELEDEPSELKVHDEVQWVTFEDLGKYSMTALDMSFLKVLASEGARFRELDRIHVRSCAFFFGVFHAALGLIVALVALFAQWGLIHSFTASKMTSPFASAGYLILFPFIYFVIGWVLGAVTASVYNIFSYFFGGIKLRWK